MALHIHDTAYIHPSVVLGPNVTVGRACYIGPYTVIGTHAEHKDADEFEPVQGAVEIGPGTIIREHVTIHASTKAETPTRIGPRCYIQAHAHIGHDAQLGNEVTIACYACVGGHAIVGDHANLGLHAVLHQMTVVGEGVMLGACAFAKGKLDPWWMYVGVPCKPIGINQRLLDRLGRGTIVE